MERSERETAEIRSRLLGLKAELQRRVSTIHEHARDPLEQDSAEQAAQLGQVAVVAALESEAIQEIAGIEAAIRRLDAGTYGICVTCEEPVGDARLRARPAATQCRDCAELDARRHQ
ncbi:MAG: TraR/DksA family transcriptional regulator [Gammaproteobacteria bacterium]|nr:TraR/DksA family transcriptional regulator [Gammaproteobacteria bacterium]